MEMFERTLNDLRTDFRGFKDEVSGVFDQLFGKMDHLKDNHFAHFQISLNVFDTRMAKLETDMDWLKRAFWATFSASVGALVVGVVNLLSK